jgi:AIR synthase-related protein
MAAHLDIAALAESLRSSAGFAAKRDISLATTALAAANMQGVPLGDDCAAIPDGDGYLLFAIEGFIDAFVARDPWFAGWCGIMVNLSDVAAMGGRPIAIVDALWAEGEENAEPLLRGLHAAATHFDVPIVGGHTNLRSAQSQLSVAILGRARKLLTSFDAQPGDRLIAAIDLRGRYRPPFLNWEAAIEAPPSRLRADLALLPEIAEAGLAQAAKDISQAGLVGTAAMLAECSQVAITIDVTAIPAPADVPLEKWLLTFPSYGYLLAVPPHNVENVLARFAARGIAAADIGEIAHGHHVAIAAGTQRDIVWDFANGPLTGVYPKGRVHA